MFIMRHVNTIRKLVDEGEAEQAHEALDNLLALGPSNVEALKLRADLFRRVGRLTEESKIWLKIIDVDREDADAIDYFYQQQVEDREHFYFTEDLPEGGRRYLAYPKSLVNTSVLGLLGCMTFLVITRFADVYPALADPTLLLGMFLILVASPWIGIIVTFLRAIRYVSISDKGLELASRFRVYRYDWNHLDHLALAHSANPGDSSLSLVIVPKDADATAIYLDVGDSSSAIRARTYLIREIAHLSQKLEYTPLHKVPIGTRRYVRY